MKGNILYLEDDEALAYATSRALKRREFDVEHHATLDSVRTALGAKHYDYALLDLKIGNETSLALVQEIKTAEDIPVVILTGYGTIRTAVKAMKLGAINFLSKPCGIDDIIAFLQDVDDCDDIETNETQKPSLRAIEWEAIQLALDQNDGNISAAARQLKMHRRTLQRKLNKRHLDSDC